MGSKNKGHRDGGTRRGGKRPGAAHSVDAGEDQPSARASQHQKNCNKNNRKKKGKEPDSDDDEDAQLKRYVEEQGLELLEMNADGNCLFRSLSDQLCGDFGSKHAIIRQQICDFMEMNKEDFEVFLVYEDKDDHEQQEEDARDYEHYIEQMRKDGEWGGHLELNAAARLFRRNITVYQVGNPDYTVSHEGSKTTGPNLMVSFHDENHYNSVRNPDAPPPKDYFKKFMAPKSSADESSNDNDESTSGDTSSSAKEDPPGEHARRVESILPGMEDLLVGGSKKSKRATRLTKRKAKKVQDDDGVDGDKDPRQKPDTVANGGRSREIRI